MFKTKRNNISLLSAIEKECQLLEPIKNISNLVVDTDVFNIHELRKWVKEAFSDEQAQKMLVNIISFGFKHGVPAESNLVYDLRYLPNRYFISELKPLDGCHEKIQEYLFSQSAVNEYWERLKSFLHYSVQKFYQEGRFFVNIGIGCTGGKHRSVAFAQKLSGEKWDHIKFLVQHRDLGKE